MAIAQDLTELVDLPNERLGVEYKVIAPTDRIGKAKLARHIAALANHGGGYIVTGFTDEMRPAPGGPALTRDDIAAIVKSFLDPPFQCDVRVVTSSAGHDHNVVIVPGHGSAPICTKVDGPHDEKGRPQGITAGTYYVRKPGPASEAVRNSAEWAPIIRRCALHERTSLLATMDVALRGAAPERQDAERLELFHTGAKARYRADLARYGEPVHGVGERHFHFSYLIAPGEGGPQGEDLRAALDRVALEVDATIPTGWGMFHVFRGANGAAAFHTDEALDRGETEFLEANFIRDGGGIVKATDLWRVAPEGIATLIRGYFVDSPEGARSGFVAGESFSPFWFLRELGEVVLHAVKLAQAYPYATQILFRCEWIGLLNRVFHDPGRRWLPHEHVANDRRVSTGTFTLGELTADRAKVLEMLAGPVARLFEAGGIMKAAWIANEMTRWKRD